MTTLGELGAALSANPAANVTMLGPYDARLEGIFSASPLAPTGDVAYTGIFDGGGYPIINFRLVDTDPTPGLEDGLFGNVGDNSGNGTVMNLTVSGSVTQTNWERATMDGAGRFVLGTTMGGVVGYNKGTLDNVVSDMTVTGFGSGGQTGGLVGRNDQWPAKTITNITQANPAEITLSANHGMSSGVRIGIAAVTGMTEINGFVGIITVTGSKKFTVAVDSTGYGAYVSGGSAYGSGTVKNCVSNAKVFIDGRNYNAYESPLVASNYGLIDNCAILATATATAPSGYVDSPPTNQYSLGWTGTASIDGDTMTVTATGLGTMREGLYLYIPNEDSGTTLPSGINVIADLGGGQWQLSDSVTLASRDLKAAEGAPGSFPSTGAWMGGASGDNGLPATSTNLMALVKNCTNYATLTNGANTNAACITGGVSGFVGVGTIQDCITGGKTSGANRTGGIAGQMAAGLAQRNIALGDVLSQRDVDGNYGANLGGICGDAGGTCTDNETYSNVLGGSTIGGAFGIVRATAVLTRFVAFGTVTQGQNSDGTFGISAGGAIGQTLAGATIDQGYCTGITTGVSRIGGVIGTLASGTNITNVYWDVDSTGNASGIGNGSSDGVASISDASLIAGVPSGFDSSWSRDASQSSFYPYINTLPLSELAGGVLPAPTIVLNPPLAVSFVGFSSSVDSATVDMPAGIQSGDYCWMFSASQNTSTTIPTNVTPSGFTLVLQSFSNTTRGMRAVNYIKILDGTETTITGMAAGTRAAFHFLLVFRPNNPVTGDTWTRLNDHVAINDGGTGVASQSMGSGTSPCLIVAASITDGGSNADPIISTGDNDSLEVASGTTPAMVGKVSYRINNTGTASSTANADTTNGAAIACVNVSLS